ncbi:hypothetical protein ACFL2F_02365, partial [Myxococcota bacterium]
TDSHWPLRRSRSFDIRVEGLKASATIQAEIVFTGQGKAGLQMQKTPGNQAAVTDLLDKVKAFLSGVPEEAEEDQLATLGLTEQKGIIVLREDATIFFGSAEDFANQIDSMLSTSSLYLDTSVDWPLHKSQKYNIAVGGTNARATIKAKVVFGGKGKVGLQIDNLPANKEALVGLLAGPQGDPAAALDGAAPEAEREPEAPEATAAEPSPEEVEEVKPDALEFQGQIAPVRGVEVLRPAKPVEVGSDACRSISLLQLIASITASGLPLALTIVLRGKQMSFRFNSRGNLVQFLSPDAGQDLLDRLVAKQLLSKARRDEVLKELGPNKFAEAVLLKKKLIRLNDLWNIVRDQVVDSFKKIQAAGGPYQINAINTGRKTGVAFGSMVIPWMETTLESADPERINSMLKPLWDKYPTLVEKPKWPLDSFAFDSRGERFINEYLDGVRTLSETMDVYPIRYRDNACRLLLILQTIGAVEVRDDPLGEEDATPEGRLARELEMLGKKSLFHQAGVHWSSHMNDYPVALKKLEKKYGTAGKLARRSPECQRICDRRLDMARKAQQTLKDPARRKEHRRSAVGEYQMKNSAELLYKQALLQLLKMDVAKARELLEVAIELEPLPEYVRKLQSI